MTKIAASLIVRDAAATIERCISSFRAHVDEINVYDTGSSDGTVDILMALGEASSNTSERLAPIRVEEGEWRDDFGWARRQSFELVSRDAEWIIWLDADDLLEGGEHLRGLVAEAPDSCDGLFILYDYRRDEYGNSTCQLWRERVIRRARPLAWEGSVHETLAPVDGFIASFTTVAPELIRVIHEPEPDRPRTDRNLILLLAESEAGEREGDKHQPRRLVHLANELMALDRPADAIPVLEAYFRHPHASHPDERAQAYHRLATCRRLLGDLEGAVSTELACLPERDDWPENAAGLAASFAALGEWAEVERWARRALELGVPHSPLPVNPVELTFLPMLRLAEACMHAGRPAEAQDWLQQAWTRHRSAPVPTRKTSSSGRTGSGARPPGDHRAGNRPSDS